MILFENSHPFAGSNRNGPFIGFNFTAQNFQESRFACSIGTNDTVTVSFGEIDVYFIKKDSLAISEGDVIYWEI